MRTSVSAREPPPGNKDRPNSPEGTVEIIDMSGTRTQAELRAVLSQWDKGDLAPLTQQQQNSWMDLAANADVRPIPNLPGDSNVPKTPGKEVGAHCP